MCIRGVTENILNSLRRSVKMRPVKDKGRNRSVKQGAIRNKILVRNPNLGSPDSVWTTKMEFYTLVLTTLIAKKTYNSKHNRKSIVKIVLFP